MMLGAWRESPFKASPALRLGARGSWIMQRYQVMVCDAKGKHLFDSTLEAPNKAVAQMMVLSQLCRNFATAPIVDRADTFVVCREGQGSLNPRQLGAVRQPQVACVRLRRRTGRQ
jgi:hypothetical protein